MRFLDLGTRITVTTLAVTVYLVLSTSLRADSILPISSFYCGAAPGFAAPACSGSESHLPSANGIEGVEMNFSGSTQGTQDLGIQYAIIGSLSGDSLAGGLIPYSFSLTALSDNEGGTEIGGYLFIPEIVLLFPPNLKVPAPFTGRSVSQTASVLQDGSCAPFPEGASNTCWGLSVTGTGFFEFSSEAVPSGTLLEIPLLVEVYTENLLGTPQIAVFGTLDLNPIPEPRCTMLVVLSAGLVFIFGRRLIRSGCGIRELGVCD